MAKIKHKNKKASAKRFKVTATGKVKAKAPGLRHNLGQKGRQAKRGKRRPLILTIGDERLIRATIPNGLR